MGKDETAKLVAERFGPRLKELRTSAGLSQRQLAERAGVSQPLLSDYENGKYVPAWDVAVALAHVLGVTVAAFTVEPSEM